MTRKTGSPAAAASEPRQAAAPHAKAQIAVQVLAAMAARRLTKVEMARRMRTSRTVLDRLLDPQDTGLTRAPSASAAAEALGARVDVRLRAPDAPD